MGSQTLIDTLTTKREMVLLFESNPKLLTAFNDTEILPFVHKESYVTIEVQNLNFSLLYTNCLV